MLKTQVQPYRSKIKADLNLICVKPLRKKLKKDNMCDNFIDEELGHTNYSCVQIFDYNSWKLLLSYRNNLYM